MTTVPSKCQALATTLAQEQRALAQIRAEYAAATGQEKDRDFYLMRAALSAVAKAQAALTLCTNPPPPLPDLHPTGFVLRWHTNKQAFDFAALVHNDGSPVSGPFQITLGVQYATAYAEITVAVPASTTIEVGATYISEYFLNVPFQVDQGKSFASDIFYVLVDPNDKITESDKTNNYLQQTMVVKPPLVVLPVGPLPVALQ